MNSNIKTIIFWAVLICVAGILWAVVRTNHGRVEKPITFTDFVDQVDEVAKKLKAKRLSAPGADSSL